MKILIVEDDLPLAEGIALYLKSSNSEFDVRIAVDGSNAVKAFSESRPDLVVLDVLLPDMSGYEVCTLIKKTSNVPIIFLSNLGEAEDKIKGLLVGGDDYVSKPFSLQELLLRINARLRDKSAGALHSNEDFTHDFGTVKLKQRLLQGGIREVLLTETEYKILLLLARNPGMTISLEEIYKVAWGGDYGGDLRTVQTHTANLRRKLEEAYGTGKYITTQWGQGYIFQS